MKKLFIILFLIILSGCASNNKIGWSKHMRPLSTEENKQVKRDFYISLGELILFQINSDPKEGMAFKKYPECKNESSKADFVNCINRIDIEEGRINPEAVKIPRPDINETMRTK